MVYKIILILKSNKIIWERITTHSWESVWYRSRLTWFGRISTVQPVFSLKNRLPRNSVKSWIGVIRFHSNSADSDLTWLSLHTIALLASLILLHIYMAPPSGKQCRYQHQEDNCGILTGGVLLPHGHQSRLRIPHLPAGASSSQGIWLRQRCLHLFCRWNRRHVLWIHLCCH